MRRRWLMWLGTVGLVALLAIAITTTVVIVGRISSSIFGAVNEEPIWAPAQLEREWLRLYTLLSQRALGAALTTVSYAQQRDVALSRMAFFDEEFLPGSGVPVTAQERALINALKAASARFQQAAPAELPSPATAQALLPLVAEITTAAHDFLNLRHNVNAGFTARLLRLLSTLRAVELGTLAGLVLVGAGLGWLTLRGLRSNLRAAYTTLQRRAQALEESQGRLTAATQLAAGRHAALEQALAELQTGAQVQAELATTVEQLTLPIIPVLAGVLVMPVIGQATAARWEAAIARLLGLIVAERCRMVVIDVTGVDDLGPVAARIQQAAQAIRLLGCTPVLAGISPGVAQALVAAGFDAATLPTYASLQQAIGGAAAQTARAGR